MNAPIVIFVYNRLKHTKALINSLEKNPEAKESVLYIFADGAKNDRDLFEVNEVQKYIRTVEKDACFRHVNVHIRQRNMGLASSVIEGVSYVFSQYDRVVVLEDDLVVAENFLSYMNAALTFYKTDPSIWSISGYTPELKTLNAYNKDVYAYYRGCSWGWGTWKDRWNTVDWNVSDFNRLKRDKTARNHFNKGGDDMFDMLWLQQRGVINSWAIRWCYQQSKNNQYTVYPVQTYVENNGMDGSGSNYRKKSRGDFCTEIKRSDCPVKLEKVSPDKAVADEYRNKFHLSLWTSIKRELKLALK